MENITKTIILWNIFNLLVSVCCGLTTGSVSTIIFDIIRNENIPSVISAINCWKPHENLEFLKRSTAPIQISTHFKINPLRSDDLTNKLWYFIDMRCDQSVTFLHGIDEAYFAHPYRWILFEPKEKSLDDLPFLTDSNVILINSNHDKDSFILNQGDFSWCKCHILRFF